MDLGLSGKTVVVSGASRGIGRAIAESFAKEGARVALVARGEQELATLCASLREQGADAHAVVADVQTEAGAAAAIEKATALLGPIEILVNNVGGSLGSGKFADVSLADFRRVVDLNMWSAVYMSHAALGGMKQRAAGVILHVSSISAREYCSSAPYAAAKAALSGLTKEMAVDLAALNIRVNAIAPGSILFEGGSWDRRSKSDPARIEKMKREELPFGRFGTPQEVAEVAVFLCSARASWVSGSTVVVDGAQGRAL